MLQSLVGVMKQASELGVLLFSQPSSFEWQWEHDEAGKVDSSQMVMLPGLFQTHSTQHRGEWLVEPRMGAA